MLIRADATPQIGAGHVMRCLALALSAKKAGRSPCLAGRVTIPWLRSQLAGTTIPFLEISSPLPCREPARDLLAQLAGMTAKWLVLDGYHFGADCHKAARGAGYRLLVIDDCAHLPEYQSDILLNQNLGADGFSYRGEIGARLFGPEYALLRPEFGSARQKYAPRVFTNRAKNVLLTLGGGDFSASLESVAPDFALPALDGCALNIIAGDVKDDVIRPLFRHCPAKLNILRQVKDVPALMRQTDLCVTAGGSACWELCCLGVPFLVVETAENQRNLVGELIARAVARPFSAESLSRFITLPEQRRQCAENGMRLVDGAGADKVARMLDIVDGIPAKNGGRDDGAARGRKT